MFTILGSDGKEYGPVTAGKVIEWMQGGRANSQTKIKRVGDTEWTTIGAIAEFGGSDGSPAAPPIATAQETAAPVLPVDANPIIRAETPLELAGRWLRLGAILLDSIIGGLLALPGLGLLMAAGMFSPSDEPNSALMIAGFLTMSVALLPLLGVQIYLLTTRGQTIGKKLLGIKIVRFDDETNPGFVKAFLLRVFVNGLISTVPVIGSLYSLVDVCFIFRADRRCIHDLIAGTKVVKA